MGDDSAQHRQIQPLKQRPEQSMTPAPGEGGGPSPRQVLAKTAAVPVILGKSCQINKMSDLTGDKDAQLSLSESNKLPEKYSKVASQNKGKVVLVHDEHTSSPSS